ncbi:MAG TPA: hypothetical protein VG733_06895, partial [Chthoniobacteraceae bacterium]|nr:hypothetical protein [Chthoniobacteraceae bacterium]
MNNRIQLYAAILLLGIGGFYGCLSYIRFTNSATRDDTSTAASAQANVAQPVQQNPDETCWVVDQTLRDIANILVHAKGDAKPAAVNVAANMTSVPYTFGIHIDSLPEPSQIALQHYVWGSENYTPVVKNLMQAWKLETPQATAPDTAMAGRLATPDASVLVAEGQRITKALATHPLDPELNEQAALLTVVFGLRESSGVFYDVRGTLCRVAAHLAVARASRPEAGPNGKLASMVLLALAGREVESLEELKPLEAAQPAWANALKMRNTGDWRITAQPASASLLEQLAWFRAATAAAGVDFAHVKFPKSAEDDRPDWGHLAGAESYSVENGHEYIKNLLVLEVAEISATWRTLSGTPMEEADLVKRLNVSPLPELPLKETSDFEVLGWPEWAAYYQRHVCSDLWETYDFIKSMLGLPEDAKELQVQIKAHFSGLTLYPFLEKRLASDAATCTEAMNAAAAICENQPWLASSANWGDLMLPNAFNVKVSVRDPAPWFEPGLLYGTTYDFFPRNFVLRLLNGAPLGSWDRLSSLAPYDYDLLFLRAWGRFGPNATAQQLEVNYSTIKDYDANALR